MLIPWEAETSKIHERMAIRAYPAAELGGYIWSYLGTGAPSDLASEVPEELSRPDEFVWFRLPMQVWNTNWLVAVDGSDAFHAVTLHADSQAHDNVVPLKDRRVQIVRNPHGVRGVSVDLQGNRIEHGHLFPEVKGERFTLPCITSNPIQPAPGVPPYTARPWQFPQDERHTIVQRFLSWRARTDEERAKARATFQGPAKTRSERVAAEDAAAAEAQGDLLEARAHENLLGPDADVIKVRKLIARAHLARSRVGISPQSLLFPL